MRVELEPGRLIVMGAGAEMGALTDHGAVAQTDFGLIVEDGVVRDPYFIPTFEVPGSPDSSRWIDMAASTEFGPEQSQKERSPRVQRT